MSCANTSLPWFIDPPRAMLPRGVAKPKFEIQIETKKINRLCVFHQQLTGAESPNVGTLLRTDYSSFRAKLSALFHSLSKNFRLLVRGNRRGCSRLAALARCGRREAWSVLARQSSHSNSSSVSILFGMIEYAMWTSFCAIRGRSTLV